MATYNGNTNVLQTTMMQDFLAHLDRNRVFTPWANRKYEGELKRQGQTIDVPVSPSHFVGTSNGDAGGTIPLKNTTISKASLTVEQVEQDRRPISDIEELRTKYSEHSEFLERMAQWLSQQQERHIGVEALRGVAADNDLVATPTSISDGYAVVRAMRKALAKKNVFGGAMFVTFWYQTLTCTTDSLKGYETEWLTGYQEATGLLHNCQDSRFTKQTTFLSKCLWEWLQRQQQQIQL